MGLPVIIFLFALLVLRFLVWARSRISFSRPRRRPTYADTPMNKRVLVVLGSGGHTAEMLQLLSGWNTTNKCELEYVVGDTDTTSVARLGKDAGVKAAAAVKVHTIPRAREVGESWNSTIISTSKAFWTSLWLVRDRRPGLLLCNGPGTCIPVLLAALVWELLAWQSFRFVFVESFCRVQRLSLAARISGPFADRCIVLWDRLAGGKWEYIGRLI